MSILFSDNNDHRTVVDKRLKKSSDLTKKMIKKNLAFKLDGKIYLTNEGILAKKIGFVRYFELEELEKKVLTSKYKRKCRFIRLLIIVLMSIIFVLSYLTLTKFENL